ncbi:hypothetical protein D3C81_1947290 [compost metagenome]
MRHVRVGLNILDHMAQTLTEQRLNLIDQAQAAGFRERHQGDALTFGKGAEAVEAATAEAGGHRVMEVGRHGGSLCCCFAWGHTHGHYRIAQID